MWKSQWETVFWGVVILERRKSLKHRRNVGSQFCSFRAAILNAWTHDHSVLWLSQDRYLKVRDQVAMDKSRPFLMGWKCEIPVLSRVTERVLTIFVAEQQCHQGQWLLINHSDQPVSRQKSNQSINQSRLICNSCRDLPCFSDPRILIQLYNGLWLLTMVSL